MSSAAQCRKRREDYARNHSSGARHFNRVTHRDDLPQANDADPSPCFRCGDRAGCRHRQWVAPVQFISPDVIDRRLKRTIDEAGRAALLKYAMHDAAVLKRVLAEANKPFGDLVA